MNEKHITEHTLAHYYLARRMGFTATAEALLEIARNIDLNSDTKLSQNRKIRLKTPTC